LGGQSAQSQPPDHRHGEKQAGAPFAAEPADTPRDPGDPWGETTFKANDPIQVWREALKEFGRCNEALFRLLREQDILLERLRGETVDLRPGMPTLRGIPRMRERGRLIAALHANEQSVEQAEAKINDVAKRVADHAPQIRQRLAEIQEDLDKRLKKNQSDSTPQAARRIERQKDWLALTVRMMVAIEADPNHAVEKVVETMRRIVEFKDRHGPAVALQQMEEQMDSLEREQSFLRQRLEAYEEDLRALRGRFQALTEFQHQRRLLPGEGGETTSTASVPARSDTGAKPPECPMFPSPPPPPPRATPR
jgi:FtsZ-binding cell division protein ZapB